MSDPIEYLNKDVEMIMSLYHKMKQTPPKKKLTRRQSREIGRGIRKRLRIEKEMRAFFIEITGVKPLDWQLDVLVRLKMSGFSSFSLYYHSRGAGWSVVKEVIDEYMHRHRIRQKKLKVASTGVTFDRQLIFYERSRNRRIDMVDAMAYSLMQIQKPRESLKDYNEHWHYDFPEEDAKVWDGMNDGR